MSPKRSNTPASIAEAMDIGIRSIMRSNQALKPQSVINPPEIRKAPMASAIGTPDAVVINIAAPGVDHAVTIGTR
nr:hypothetical protein [Nostoc linckia]